ncbi:MAG: feruloyl-CoA synthetase [Rhodobacteraceae bacterium]|nr:MAG: feruloyl-CoA synthetase [Paracoccaceae bacterium]
MKRTTNFQPHNVHREDRADGTILLTSKDALSPSVERTGDWLHNWAEKSPDTVFIAERSGAGWRQETYLSTLQKVRAIAASLLARGLNADTPILIMSGNSVDHALLSLAGQYAGIPTVPLAEQYSLITEAHGRLIHAIELVEPKMAFVSDVNQYKAALELDQLNGIEIVASNTGNRTDVTSFSDLLKGDAGVDVDAAFGLVNADTVAKLLMTSGSTSLPKAVLTTHKMMCVNQAMMKDSLPFLNNGPPVLVDWLPWNHVFGGSNNINMALSNGGSFYIDDGKPTKKLFARTIENLNLQTGTIAFNVPLGFSWLLDALRKDDALSKRFFSELDLILYAGASLPQDVWQGYEALAMKYKGEVPLMTSSWGLTETAPSVMIQQEPTERSGVIGVPMNGTIVKLIPDKDMRCEVRVKGDNVMPGYFKAPEKTAESFDDEGFFITGDAMKFVDPTDMNRGMRFDGRISEDFKLLSGTWVRAAQLRIDMLVCLGPVVADLVITGANLNQIGVMIFPDMSELSDRGFDLTDDNGAITDPKLLAEIKDSLAERAKEFSASSIYVSRAIVLSEPLSIGDGELTPKGSINFVKVLTRRADLLERLYDDADPATANI